MNRQARRAALARAEINYDVVYVLWENGMERRVYLPRLNPKK